jgi:hypothetical protein
MIMGLSSIVYGLSSTIICQVYLYVMGLYIFFVVDVVDRLYPIGILSLASSAREANCSAWGSSGEDSGLSMTF